MTSLDQGLSSSEARSGKSLGTRLYKHQYSNDLWPLKIKRNCILLINRSKILIKLIIKNAVGLILDNFGIVGFLFFSPIPVDSSHFSLHFHNILSPKAPKYFILNVLK